MANRAAGTYEVDPISRIEGHLGVKVTTDGTKITEAKAHGNLWRGFENFLLGRDVNDAITFTQRICGVCPVPHGLTATYACDAVLGYSENHITFAEYTVPGPLGSTTYGVPAKAVLIRNLVLSSEFLMSSITHFYHLAAPSYVQGPAIPPWTPYFANSYYNPLLRNPGGGPGEFDFGSNAVPELQDGFSKNLWSTVIRSYVKALRIRRLTFEAGALFAGRMPMTSCFIGGGVTFDGAEDLGTFTTGRIGKFVDLIKEVGLFIVQEYVPIVLALGALYPQWDNLANATLSDAVEPYHVPGTSLWDLAGNTGAPGASNTGYGKGLGRFISWGCFPNIDASGTLALPGGYVDDAVPADNFTATNRDQIRTRFINEASGVPAKLTEDIANSRYVVSAIDDAAGAYTGTAAYPGDVARTEPSRDKAGAYTYMKAPRWNGKSCEVGPLARLVVAGLYGNGNGNGLTNKLAGGGLATQFAKYLKGSGINPALIEADIAVALVRSGVAKLYSNGVTYSLVDTALPTGAGARTAIANAYNHPTAEIRGHIVSWILGIQAGRSTMDRLRARGLESLYLVQQMLGDFNGATWAGGWAADLVAQSDVAGSTWKELPIPTGEVQGWGAVEAPRGALMHQVTINGGKITKYQCIVPTTWNGSPATVGYRGAIEQACIDVPFSDAGAKFTSAAGGSVTSQGGVEVLRVAQSFDPCIACAVH